MQERIRVLFVTHTLDLAAGGAEQVLYDILAELDRSRFEPILAAPAPPISQRPRLEALSIELVELPRLNLRRGSRWGQLLQASSSLIRLCIRTAQAIRDTRPHVAHVNSVVALHFSAIALLFMRVPFVYHEHGLVEQRRASPWRFMFRALLKAPDRLIANALTTKRQLIHAGAKPSEIIIAYNGLRIGSRNPRRLETNARDSGEFRVVQIANLHRWKGHSTVINALAQLKRTIPSCRLVIFGGGAEPGYLAELQDLVVRNRLADSVTFAGYVEGAAEKLTDFDCLVVASESEPFGLVILEALWANVPVVATRAGGVPEIITDQEDGLLFEPGDDTALADRLQRIAADSRLRQRLRETGRATVIDRFSTARQARMIEQILVRLSKNKSENPIGL